MTDYRVLLFIVVSAVGGIALAVWMLKRFGLHLLGAFVSAIIAFVITALGYWLGIGLAFTYLDVAPGNVAPWWADWVVGCDSMALAIAVKAGKKVFSCIPAQGKALTIPFPQIIKLFQT